MFQALYPGGFYLNFGPEEKADKIKGACPSVFSWTSKSQERYLPSKRLKLQAEQELFEAELTATASEGEGEFDETARDDFISRGIQLDLEVPCTHRFSIDILRSLL